MELLSANQCTLPVKVAGIYASVRNYPFKPL